MARKKRQEDSAGAPWMNTFADLMNLLLCFFVMLFAASTVDADKYDQLVKSFSSAFSILDGGEGIGEGDLISNGAAQLSNLDEYDSMMGKASETNEKEETDPLNAYQEKLEEAAQKNYDTISKLAEEKNLDDYVDIGIDENSQFIKISLSGAVLFDSGQINIKKNAIPILNKVGDILKRYNNAQIVIEGHTDNVPISNSTYKNNLWLSTARACTVYEYFINEKGLDPRTLESSGRSEFDPIASNKTEEGRAKNRRVEIKIYNEVRE